MDAVDIAELEWTKSRQLAMDSVNNSETRFNAIRDRTAIANSIPGRIGEISAQFTLLKQHLKQEKFTEVVEGCGCVNSLLDEAQKAGARGEKANALLDKLGLELKDLVAEFPKDIDENLKSRTGELIRSARQSIATENENQIETLICSAEKIKRLNFLSSSDCRLRRLSVDCGYTSEPSPNNLLGSLRFAKNLERLDIVRSDIESLDFLNGCKNLKRISLQGNGQLVNIDALSDSADSLESITLAYNRQLLEHGVLEKEMSQLKELVVYDAQRKYKFLDNLHLDLKGDLNRFDHLEVPNRAIIGRKFEWQDIWNFTNELNLEN